MKILTPAIRGARRFSDAQLSVLRKRIANLVPQDEIVLTCGSYARREASVASDIDFFVITRQSPPAEGKSYGVEGFPWFEQVKHAISTVVPVEAAEGGAFANVESSEQMLHNIGGEYDNNAKMTRRMLFLLEGEWLAKV